MLRSGLTKGSIDDYLQRGRDDDRCTSFQTADKLWSLLERVEHGFGPRSWSAFPCGSGTLYSRNILHCIRLLLSNLPFADHMVFGRERLLDSSGRKVYNEIHTADWWWDTQDLVPRGGTVVPLLFASDKTHLTNFSGDKAAWPVYMSISNISKDFRRQGSKHHQNWYSAPGAPHASGAPSAHNVNCESGRNVDLTLHSDFASPDVPRPDAILTRTLRSLRPDCAWFSALVS